MTTPDFSNQAERLAKMKELFDGYDEKVSSLADYASAGWDHPLDLFAEIDPPVMDINLLPLDVRAYVAEESTNMGVDPGSIGLNVMIALASCIDSRIRLQPKRHDHRFTVAPRLWGMIVGGPSDKKSPAQASALRPIRAIQSLWNHSNRTMAQEYAENPEDRPLYKQLMLGGDTTVEGLARKLSESEPRGILIVRDELAGWFGSMDAYNAGSGKDKPAWLEIWNGGDYTVTRASKNDQYIENWGANIIGNIQPAVIAAKMSKMENDGLMARFLVYCMKPSTLGEDVKPEDANYLRYSGLCNWLTTLEPGETIKLSEEAHVWREKLDQTIHSFTSIAENEYLKGVLGKWYGISYAMILIYHCCECHDGKINPCKTLVSERSVRDAISMMGLLYAHAVRFYGEIDPKGSDVKDLANLLLAQNTKDFTVKTLFNRYWRASRTMEYNEQRTILARLEGAGWIRPSEVLLESGQVVYEKMDENRRPDKFQVNPAVHRIYTRQAIKEKMRRHEQSQILIALKSHKWAKGTESS